MENSHIEWTTHTFNPWHGCMKISEGCKNCYAEALDNRWNHKNPHWGPNSPRKPMSDKYWSNLQKWNKEAEEAGVNAKVFVASMADWAEGNDTLKDSPSQLMVSNARLRLFQAIATTPNLTYQLLTKRPDNIWNIIENTHTPLEMHDIFEDGNKEYLSQYKEAYNMLRDWLNGKAPDNVWLGTSVENQYTYDKRVPELLKVFAKVHFLSCEPLLGPINIDSEHEIDWIIAGGESGHGARPMHPQWVNHIRHQCIAFNISFFFKQWGEYRPYFMNASPLPEAVPLNMFSSKMFIQREGKFIAVPKGMSTTEAFQDYVWFKCGKKEAGSLLNGIEYKESPK